MCVQEAKQVAQEIENLDNRRRSSWPLHCELLHTQMENFDKTSSFTSSTVQNSCPLESINEDTMIADKKQILVSFVPDLRSGEWSDIGERPYMEDTHICIGDLANKFNNTMHSEEAVSFYGVSHLAEYA